MDEVYPMTVDTSVQSRNVSNVALPKEYYLNVDGDMVQGSVGTSSSGGFFDSFGKTMDFKMPEFDFDFGFGTDAKGADGKSTGGGFGSTLQGIGAVTGALASIYGIHEQKKYQDEVLGMEKERVAKNEARRDAKQAEYDKVWGA